MRNLDFFAAIDKYKPTDATTNPSLVLAAALKDQYASVVDDAVKFGQANGRWEFFSDKCLVCVPA